MAQRHTDTTTAQMAWEEFYHRHRQYLYHVACKVGMVNASDRSDLVQETFLRVFEKAHTFQEEDSTDNVHGRIRVRAWMGRIAHRLFQDMLKKYGCLRLLGDMEAAVQDDAQTQPPATESDESPSPALQAVLQVIESLSAREQEIMRVTWQYYTPGQQQRLPHDVVAQLARDFKTSPENIRKIRERALRKMKAMLLSSPHSPKEETQP
jgi:RNA polymerase sigma factor (sigma-70 family)